MLLVAAGAPIALVIAAVAPAAWALGIAWSGLIILMMLFDALMAPRVDSVRFSIAHFGEVGQPLAAQMQVMLKSRLFQRSMEGYAAVDSRLDNSGRSLFKLRRDEQAIFERDDPQDKRDIWSAEIVFTPHRRGPAMIERCGVRWSGPLGLVWRQQERTCDHEVRILPDVSPIRSPTVQLFLRDALYGIVARKFRGEGTEFDALADYQPGMDRRSIDWKGSARHTKLLAKEYDTERNNQIVFAVDCGKAMCEPIDNLPRVDRAVQAALLTGFAALKSGDRASIMAFAAQPEIFSPFVTGTREFHRFQSEAGAIDYRHQETNFTLAMATLAARLKRRSLIVVLTDFADTTSAELMLESVGRLVDRHLVLFVVMKDAVLEDIAEQAPRHIDGVAESVTADALITEKQLVISRLQHMGVSVIEAPHQDIGTQLLNAYLRIKKRGTL
ncbi:DUF58 domain-containing protein [Alterisphingorhabdus coralli]|uniref:DUF58 domain-containing protein n=1 Tax=Alterisphingorhabdus coralli TaxID=3071408 RepID=A0AA97I0Y4_9SPHN|nr:DUF58 domain-containing protein [Parasphingorhabdus sp. SCSIO 66989]WOE76174.1 DUF58 domain-containing protein [Parasphingorhabdus sp. SCSIO 66989]